MSSNIQKNTKGEMKMTVAEAKNELMHLRKTGVAADEIVGKINRLEQPYRDMLVYRYTRALRWREVARIMEYSQDHLRGYMNKKAIEKYARVGQGK